jgi:hypothetical protein
MGRRGMRSGFRWESRKERDQNEDVDIGKGKGKDKVIPVQAVEALRVAREVEAPTFSDIRLTDGGEVVSPTCRPPFTPRKIPDTHFC